MFKIEGTHNIAVCYCAELEKAAAGQIRAVCDQEAFADSKIRVMPDVHAGLGCTIGTTMTITDKVVPGMVGVDMLAKMKRERCTWSSIPGAGTSEMKWPATTRKKGSGRFAETPDSRLTR